MIVDDLSQLTNPLGEFDVCIVGSGPAGITLAYELMKEKARVLMLEAGGIKPDDTVQADAEMENVGLAYDPLNSRLRMFGGSSNHWAGWCRTLSETEFAVPDSAWPRAVADIFDYYPRAHWYCDIGPVEYSPDAWVKEGEGHAPVAGTNAVETQVWQFSPNTRFGKKFRKRLAKSEFATVLLNATCVGAVVEDDKVTALRVRSSHGDNEVTVSAKFFVLATGGLENPRLLKILNGPGRPELGNQHDNVGRYFTDHVILNQVCQLFPTGGQFDFYSENLVTSFVPKGLKTPLEVLGVFTPTTEAAIRFGLRNIIARLEPVSALKRSDGGDAFEVLEYLRAADTDGDAATPAESLSMHEAVIAWDHLPYRESRVTLHPTKKDRFGLPVGVLDWRLHPDDFGTVMKFAKLFGLDLGGSKQGRIRLVDSPSLDDLVNAGAWVGNHHTGTTRISVDETDGVVDPNLKVHGMGNLYVAGSSVYPSSAACTPTLTIVAFSIRLAKHITARLTE